MRRHKSIFLSGYYGVCNVGDDLLLRIIVDKLLDYNPTYEISIKIDDSKNISESLRNRINCIKVPKMSGNKFMRIINTISQEIAIVKNHDIYIYGGGTRLFETKNRTYQPFFIKFLVLFYNRIFLGRKVIHLGNGIGNVNSKLGKMLLRNILNMSNKLYLRDTLSYQKALFYLKDKNRAEQSCDLAYSLFDETKREKDVEVFRIGLSFFDYYNYIERNEDEAEKFERKIKALIHRLNKIRNVKFYLFSFQKNHGGNDERFNENLLSSIIDIDIIHVKYNTDAMSFYDQIGRMDFCIGMRYHFCLMSLINKIPCVGINYQPKVRSEYEDLELHNFVFEIDELDKIDEKIVHLEFEVEGIQKKMSLRKSILDEHFNEVNRIIDEAR